jgi:predicted 3-demethylubiquinone-9 3-methyltransferase (glyoxalase superfamily)
MPKVTPFIAFTENAEPVAKYYASFLPTARIVNTTYYGENMHLPKGTVLTVVFELAGTQYVFLNCGKSDYFRPSAAFSLCLECDTQEEIDTYWAKLTDGGTAHPCGWLTDKFGLTWQVNARLTGEVMTHGTPAAQGKLTAAMMKMEKIDLAALKAAVASA